MATSYGTHGDGMNTDSEGLRNEVDEDIRHHPPSSTSPLTAASFPREATDVSRSPSHGSPVTADNMQDSPAQIQVPMDATGLIHENVPIKRERITERNATDSDIENANNPEMSDTILDVTCGPNKAKLYLCKLMQGSRGCSVLYDKRWLTPNEFQYVSGRGTAKDWKRSIKHHGRSLKLLLVKGVMTLQPPGCQCDGCTPGGLNPDNVPTPPQPPKKEKKPKKPIADKKIKHGIQHRDSNGPSDLSPAKINPPFNGFPLFPNKTSTPLVYSAADEKVSSGVSMDVVSRNSSHIVAALHVKTPSMVEHANPGGSIDTGSHVNKLLEGGDGTKREDDGVDGISMVSRARDINSSDGRQASPVSMDPNNSHNLIKDETNKPRRDINGPDVVNTDGVTFKTTLVANNRHNTPDVQLSDADDTNPSICQTIDTFESVQERARIGDAQISITSGSVINVRNGKISPDDNGSKLPKSNDINENEVLPTARENGEETGSGDNVHRSPGGDPIDDQLSSASEKKRLINIIEELRHHKKRLIDGIEDLKSSNLPADKDAALAHISYLEKQASGALQSGSKIPHSAEEMHSALLRHLTSESPGSYSPSLLAQYMGGPLITPSASLSTSSPSSSTNASTPSRPVSNPKRRDRKPEVHKNDVMQSAESLVQQAAMEAANTHAMNAYAMAYPYYGAYLPFMNGGMLPQGSSSPHINSSQSHTLHYRGSTNDTSPQLPSRPPHPAFASHSQIRGDSESRTADRSYKSDSGLVYDEYGALDLSTRKRKIQNHRTDSVAKRLCSSYGPLADNSAGLLDLSAKGSR